MNIQDYIDYLSEINKCLYKTEGKPSANIHPAYNLWFETEISNEKCYGFYSTDRVRQILETDFLQELSKNYPENFNAGDPNKVLEALAQETKVKLLAEYQSNSSKETTEEERALWYSDYYYIITNTKMNKTIRLDLLRLIGKNNQGEIDFKGGLFHAFKHFSKDSIAISHKMEPTELPRDFVKKIAEVIFFEEPLNRKTLLNGNEELLYQIEIDSKSFQLRVYFNKECNVHFLNTIHRV